MNCARCHDHKYDPLTQRDFYGLLAFFHNVPESGVGDYGANIRRSTPPFLKLPTPALATALEHAKAELATTSQKWTNLLQQLDATRDAWEERAKMADPKWRDLTASVTHAGTNTVPLGGAASWTWLPNDLSGAPQITLQAPTPAPGITAIQIEFQTDGVTSNALAVAEIQVQSGDFTGAFPRTNRWTLTPVALTSGAPVADLNPGVDGKPDTAWHLHSTNIAAGSGTFLITGRTNRTDPEFRLVLQFLAAESHGAWRFRVRTTDLDPTLLLPPTLAATLAQPAAERTAEARQSVEEFRRSRTPEHEDLRQRLAALNRQIDELDLATPITLVMSEMATPRTTHVLTRGSYQQPGEVVTANTPASLLPFAAEWPRNRLGLARWLVDPRNPLTARVIVNRYWQSLFGIGLVRTAEDFGLQGEPPTHPELLDWLAGEFIRSGWNVKAMLKLLVTSATYRQDSHVRPELASADPENRWLGRGPRFRWPIETVRDQALAVSGLLVEQIGGPSVRPYHPPGLYEQVVAGSSASTYVTGTGTELYRRTLYTYVKRSVPNPALLMFDLPFRETCTVRRARTSTPLQALNLMNDPTYVEAARALAERMMTAGGNDVAARLRYGFRLTVSREPQTAELDILSAGWRRAESAFRQDPAAATDLITVGASRANGSFDPVALAAYTLAASTLLNLDETITKH